MDKKVAELIERVRLTDKEIRAAHSYWNNLSVDAIKRVRVIAEAQLNKVLNDPDLTLRVDGIRKCAGEDGAMREYITDELIPLREALKKAKK